MNRFCCRNCGMITDNPEIIPNPKADKEYKRLATRYFHASLCRRLRGIFSNEDIDLIFRYNYSITCPVCENETRFWREEPFPADKESGVKKTNCPNCGLSILIPS